MVSEVPSKKRPNGHPKTELLCYDSPERQTTSMWLLFLTMNPTLHIPSAPIASARSLPLRIVVQILGVLGVLAVKNALSDDAADMSELTAAQMTLQRHAPLFPPANSVSAAAMGELLAGPCSGSFANSAKSLL